MKNDLNNETRECDTKGGKMMKEKEMKEGN